MPKRTTAKNSFSSAVFQPEILPVVKETVEVSVPEVVPVVEESVVVPVPEVLPVVEETAVAIPVPVVEETVVVPVVEERVVVPVPEVVPIVEDIQEVVPVVEESVPVPVPEVAPVVEESVAVPVQEVVPAMVQYAQKELTFASLLPVSSDTKSFQDILDEKASMMEQLKNMATSDVDITTYQPLKKEEEQPVSAQQQHYNSASFWNKFIPRRA